MEILFALQSTDYESVVIVSGMNYCFCKTKIKAEIEKKKNYTETTCPDYFCLVVRDLCQQGIVTRGR